MERSKEHTYSIDDRRSDIFRSMSAEEKLNAASRLYYSDLALKETKLQRTNPEWSTEKVRQKTREWMLYART